MADSTTSTSRSSGTTLLRLALATAGLVALGTAVSAPFATPWTAPAEAQASQLADGQPDADAWRKSVWSTASAGDLDQTLALLADVPDEADPAATADLRASVELLLANIEKRDTARAEQIQEQRAEFRDALDAARTSGDDADVSEALALALLVETLVEDKAAFRNEPEVIELIDLAAKAARQAEADEDWLAASELFARLNMLTETSQDFKADLQRQILRRDQLILYIPEMYWNMRDARLRELEQRALDRWNEEQADVINDAAVAEDEEEPREPPTVKGLPAYVERGDAYTVKLADITADLALAAINNASYRHISSTTIRDMAQGGLDVLEMLLDTSAMTTTFPSLADAAKLAQFNRYIDEERQRLAELNQDISIFDLRKTLQRLLSVNAETVALPDQVVIHEFGAGAMNTLDEFTAIIWPHELRQFYKRLGSSFIGVGVQIVNDPITGDLKVFTPLSGMPAQRAGVRAEDIITHVNGEPMIGISTEDAVDIITGPKGTDVTLTIKRDDDGEELIKDITITRAEIDIPTVTGWKRLRPENDIDAWDWFVDRNQGVGYIRLEKFAEESTREIDAALDHMRDRGLRALILDLRFNSGGQFDRAIEITNRIVPTGTLVSTVNSRTERPETHRATPRQALLRDIPVAVLINSNSASASEIVAGAVKAHARRDNADAIVIGERSYGKGTVQNVHGIARQTAAMKVTTQYYQLPDGSLIHRRKGSSDWGVTPNLNISLLPGQVSDSLRIRSRADVIQIDEAGNEIADAEERRDPSELITEGIDLQLQTALVLLKARVPTETSSTAMRDDG
ncbi:MAG: S41 family peptidase [Planctomycetota bacterium]